MNMVVTAIPFYQCREVVLISVVSIEILQIKETSHRPLCKWQRQSGNSVRAKERDDGRFFLSLSTRTALERDSLTL